MEPRNRFIVLSFLIISIIAVTAILTCPPPAVRLQKGKPEIGRIQIKELEGALQLFRYDTGRHPTTAEGLNALVRNPGLAACRGAYLSKGEFTKAPWGRPYVCRCPGQHGAYDLVSYGADGIEGGEEDIMRWESAPRGR